VNAVPTRLGSLNVFDSCEVVEQMVDPNRRRGTDGWGICWCPVR